MICYEHRGKEQKLLSRSITGCSTSSDSNFVNLTHHQLYKCFGFVSYFAMLTTTTVLRHIGFIPLAIQVYGNTIFHTFLFTWGCWYVTNIESTNKNFCPDQWLAATQVQTLILQTLLVVGSTNAFGLYPTLLCRQRLQCWSTPQYIVAAAPLLATKTFVVVCGLEAKAI